VIVIGGGFGGATCARNLHRLGMAVTLIEENAVYTSCPFSNLVLHGSRDIGAQQFTYEAIAREGV
jgi:flavin-dependent dehydrogenase